VPDPRRCTSTTRSGRPCRAWAVRGTDPPAGAAHAGRNVGAGAPEANQNARTHGFYASVLDPQELADPIAYADDMTLDDEIACAASPCAACWCCSRPRPSPAYRHGQSPVLSPSKDLAMELPPIAGSGCRRQACPLRCSESAALGTRTR
jgi:hypothetical protein